MSMHEIEDLVEESVRILAVRSDLDLRSLYWQLYDYQNHWDTGFTNFRVMDLLLQARYTYRFDLNQHPDYTQYRDYFDGLTGFDAVREKPIEPYGQPVLEREKGWVVPNPMAGYARPPYLYCDVGSPLWARFVKLGVLSNGDAIPPDAGLNIVDAALAVMRLAELGGDVVAIYGWYALLSTHIASFFDLDSLRDNAALGEILDITRRNDAFEAAKARDPKMIRRYPAPPFVYYPVSGDTAAYLAFLKENIGSYDDL